MSSYLSTQLLNMVFGGAAFTPPSDYYFGLIAAPNWEPQKNYAVGDFVVATNFPSPPRIWRCDQAGASGATEPTWPDQTNATVNDGTAVWKDATSYLESGNLSGLEVSTAKWTNYVRIALPNIPVSYTTVSGLDVVSKKVAVPISYGVANIVGSPLQVVMMFISDSQTGGNVYDYGALNAALQVAHNASVSFPANSVTLSMK